MRSFSIDLNWNDLFSGMIATKISGIDGDAATLTLIITRNTAGGILAIVADGHGMFDAGLCLGNIREPTAIVACAETVVNNNLWRDNIFITLIDKVVAVAIFSVTSETVASQMLVNYATANSLVVDCALLLK